jgi:hypothetical protein
MLMLDRRMLLRAGSAAVGAAALAPTAPALAHAPQPGKRAQPSFYRFKLGTIEITVVSDGTLAFPAETLWSDRAEDARGLLTSTFQPSSPGGLQINTILVNTGDKLVLIDAGCGVDKFQKTAGGLLGNLAAAGYAPGDIDMILFTHCHFDHLWGISDHQNASLVFPSAEFVSPALRPRVDRLCWPAPNFIGGQRYAAAWTGDNTANWEHLKMSIPMILNLGLSGQPFAGADIGGYRYSKDEKPQLTKEDDAKLFERWLGFGALYPFSRAHYERKFGPQGTPPPGWQREPWSFPDEIVESNRRAIDRRYRLLPYLYTVFHEASTSGLPVMDPLFFADPKDPQLRGVDDSFLLGSDLLVAVQVDPAVVTKPVLPKGIWCQIGFPVEGEKEPATDIDTPNLPSLHVRGGAIVPTGPLMQYTSEKPLDQVTLLICLDDQGKANGSLYEDAGDGFDYLKGAYRLTTYRASVTNGSVVVTSSAEGKLPPSNRSVAVRVFWHDKEFTGNGKEAGPISITVAHP